MHCRITHKTPSALDFANGAAAGAAQISSPLFFRESFKFPVRLRVAVRQTVAIKNGICIESPQPLLRFATQAASLYLPPCLPI